MDSSGMSLSHQTASPARQILEGVSYVLGISEPGRIFTLSLPLDRTL